MTMIEVKVPSMACSACVQSISDRIKSEYPEASINADLETKKVSIETTATEAIIRQLILDAGHELA